jgi:hypothetical protein
MVMFIFLIAFNAVILLSLGILAFLFGFEADKYCLEISAAVAFLHLFEHESFRGALHVFYFISIKI